MKSRWVWIFGLLAALGWLAAGAAVVMLRHSSTPPVETAAASEPAAAEGGAAKVKLTAEQVEQAGIKTDEVSASTLTPEARLYGVIQEDPGESFTVRAQVAGTVAGAEGRSWPNIGETLADGTVVGTLEPRVMPSDQMAMATQRTTLQTQAASADAEMRTATASLEAARESYDRLKALNEQDKNISDRAVQEALAKVRTEEAHLAGATQTADLAKAALKALEVKLASSPLTVSRGGEVVEVLVHPGESVEAGQAILRVTRFDHALAAVNVPIGEDISPAAKTARIVPMGSAKPLAGVRIGTAAATDPRTHDPVLMFRLPTEGDTTLRPGTPVVAFVPSGGEALKGVVVPRTAIVRYQGKAWVYVAADKETFERREVALEHPSADGDGWFVMQGVKAGETVVTTGAAVILSDELKVFAGGE